MDAPVYDLAGEELRRVTLPAAVFDIEPNRAAMHQALVRQLANVRRGTHQTQTRSEVSRTGAKWFKQKGTGRARHGDRTANVFVGGAVVHGPQHRDYGQRMPRRMRRLALRSALAVKAREGAVALVDGLAMDEPRTRTISDLVTRVCDDRPTLVLLARRNDNIERSIRNLPHVAYLQAGYLNVRDLLGYDRLLLETDALAQVVAHLSGAALSRDEGEAEDA
jgi:large subunit ribosomal protein L4